MTGLISPALALGAILSTVYAALFHLWQKGEMQTLRRYLFVAWLGFAVGHVISDVVGIQLLRVGQLSVFGGTVGALAGLMIAKTREA